ncbi:MAG: pilin [Candidatus Gracilibacteria bacterium]|nr:pilin [Candidatus Gracilibacteria bacterium]
MIKKLILILFLFISFFSVTNASCVYSEGGSISSFLNGCKPKTVVGASDMKIESGFKTAINKWVVNISLILGVLAVGALVYAGFLMQLSGGADEKIKKSKDIITWTVVGIIALTGASGVIYIVVNLIFGLGGSGALSGGGTTTGGGGSSNSCAISGNTTISISSNSSLCTNGSAINFNNSGNNYSRNCGITPCSANYSN